MFYNILNRQMGPWPESWNAATAAGAKRWGNCSRPCAKSRRMLQMLRRMPVTIC